MSATEPALGAGPECEERKSSFGPGLITGSADDDPSGIATYSQAGAAFGYSLGWAVVITLPLMVAVQEISARIGRVTGKGLGSALRAAAPKPLLFCLVALLSVANIINLGADLGAMAAAVNLLIGGPVKAYAFGFALICIAAETWISYKRYVSVLKWLTVSLLAYVALLFVVRVPIGQALRGALIPHLALSRDASMMLVAVLGTTISPYLFFWQASEEAEDERCEPDPRPLRQHAWDAPAEMARIGWDTWVGMLYSNIVALAILVGSAATLHANGVTDIGSAADAAKALEPIAGSLATAIFSLGIVGTGLLAVPTLAGSTAYAIGEALDLKVGLDRKAGEAKAFYGIIAASTLLGTGIVFSPIDPLKALVWAAVINGAAAAPVIVALVWLGSKRQIMGSLVLPLWLKLLGWLTALLMAGATAAMVAL